ncbi:MAG: hypothetical protein KAH18_12065, partial [Psychromonas sp.]|nr:hypothetical protein [Psychromonas sp.]
MISHDVKLNEQSIETIYQKRCDVEVFQKNIKLSKARANSPAKITKAQSNPIFIACYSKIRVSIPMILHYA